MENFHYKNGQLYIEDTSVQQIADAVETPFYCYSESCLRKKYNDFAQAASDLKSTICFAVKANANLAVIKTFASLGAGADVVSGGELLLALKGGIPADKIVFSGIGKTAEELELAVTAGIRQINIESLPEALLLNQVALAHGKRVTVAVRINPDVDALTHDKIATGKKENKFGISWESIEETYKKIGKLPGLNPVAVDVHIGSQLIELMPFRDAFSKVAEMVRQLRRMCVDVQTIDVGGGLGVPYKSGEPEPDIREYMNIIKETLGSLKCHIIFEPGRYLCAEAGLLVSKITYLKQTKEKTFAILDAGMNDLIRPAMYDAWHDIMTVKESVQTRGYENTKVDVYDFVGPVCESSDVFAKQRFVPTVRQDDLVVIRTAGAYGSSMSSNYNMHPLIPEVLVNGEKFAVVRQKQTFEEIIAQQLEAPWQQQT